MIAIKNAGFSYAKKPVLQALQLDFYGGHIYGLLGKNGTGKTTLLKCMQCGTITVNGYTPKQRQPGFLQEVFFVSDEFYMPDVPVAQYIKMNAPFYPHFNRQQMEGYLKEFEIPFTHSLQQLSYGQRKKVFISFALACNTAVLLMDEPTNGLDIVSKRQFRKVIAGVLKEDKCIIISTHQVKDLEQLIDHITVIDEGKILFDEDVNTVAARLSFDYDAAGDGAGALYSEHTLNGVVTVSKNNSGMESNVDMEMLYKAIVHNGAGISRVVAGKEV